MLENIHIKSARITVHNIGMSRWLGRPPHPQICGVTHTQQKQTLIIKAEPYGVCIYDGCVRIVYIDDDVGTGAFCISHYLWHASYALCARTHVRIRTHARTSALSLLRLERACAT